MKTITIGLQTGLFLTVLVSTKIEDFSAYALLVSGIFIGVMSLVINAWIADCKSTTTDRKPRKPFLT